MAVTTKIDTSTTRPTRTVSEPPQPLLITADDPKFPKCSALHTKSDDEDFNDLVSASHEDDVQQEDISSDYFEEDGSEDSPLSLSEVLAWHHRLFASL